MKREGCQNTIHILPLTNTMGDFSVYKMAGVDKLIIRDKGGPTKEQIANDPQFERLRKCQSEFAGAGKASGLIMATTNAINHLADHSFGGMLTKVCRLIQMKETMADPGKRPILFSKYGKLLEGMNFNDRKVIDSVLKNLPGFTHEPYETDKAHERKIMDLNALEQDEVFDDS